jgi:hypothetical protein
MRDDKQPTFNEAEPQRSKIEQDGSTEKPTNEYVLVSWSTAEAREHAFANLVLLSQYISFCISL